MENLNGYEYQDFLLWLEEEDQYEECQGCPFQEGCLYYYYL